MAQRTEHTPGPWEFADDWKQLDFEVFATCDRTVRLAQVLSPRLPDREIGRANARLIAAAPKMFEALNRMLVSFAGQDEELCMECGEKSGTGEGCDTCYVIGEAIKAVQLARARDGES